MMVAAAETKRVTTERRQERRNAGGRIYAAGEGTLSKRQRRAEGQ